jgi:hypothetical protein
MAEIESTPEGDVPRGNGWYVLNARRARWVHIPGMGGSDCRFRASAVRGGAPDFESLL